MNKSKFLLALVFFLSGSASLIYQVVWQRVLTLYYGVESISITLIVSVFMFGLGIGSLLGGYLSEKYKNRFRIYLIVELLIGAFGLLSIPFLKFLGASTAGSGYFISFLLMFAFLAVPTILMGITLPVLTKLYNERIQNFLASVSFLYFVNTLGAAFGAIIASYVIITFFGLKGGIYSAVLINLLLASGIYLASRLSNKRKPLNINSKEESRTIKSGLELNHKVIYSLVFITGFLAIGYEIVWFRLISVFTKASPYAFSSVLFIYLIGIALGSFWMNRSMSKKRLDRQKLFFRIQFYIALSVFLTIVIYYFLTKYTGFSELTNLTFSEILHPLFAPPSFESPKTILLGAYKILDIFFWAGWFIFIPTLLMGASFPLVSSLALKDINKEGETIGRVYFFNIIGNVIGGIVTGFILLPLIGTELTFLLFILVGFGFGIIAYWSRGSLFTNRKLMSLVLGGILGTFLFPKKMELYRAIFPEFIYAQDDQIDFEEGKDGIVAMYKNKENVTNYIGGMPHGGKPGYGYYYEMIETYGYTKKLDKVLVIGFGAGSFVEALLNLEDVPEITLVELNEELLHNLSKAPEIKAVLDHPKVNIVIDDGRRYLYNTSETFDMITMDPLRTTTSFSNNLYSSNFFALTKDNLCEGGILMLWAHEHKIIPATVASVYPEVNKYPLFVLASSSKLVRDTERVEYFKSRFSPDFLSHLDKYFLDLNQVEMNRDEIVSTYGHLPINEDWNPITEYYLRFALLF